MRLKLGSDGIRGNLRARRLAHSLVRGFFVLATALLVASFFVGCGGLGDFYRGSRDVAIRHAPHVVDAATPALNDALADKLGDKWGSAVSDGISAGLKAGLAHLPPPPPPSSDPNLLYHLGTVVTTLGLLWGKGKIDKRGKVQA